MMKKFGRLASGLLLTAALTGCSAGPGHTTPSGSPEDYRYWNQFSTQLFAQVSDQANVLVSPTSAYFALAMLSDGAAGDTEKAFNTVLGQSEPALDQNAQSLFNSLQQTEGSTTLDIADGLWINQQFTVEQSYINQVKKYYDAQVEVLDLSQAKDPINRWVSKQTQGLIPELLDADPAPSDVMVLVNTLYFKGKWQQPFEAEATTEGPFTQTDGSTGTTPFLKAGDYSCRYFKTEGLEGAILPYDDGRTAFVALRPADGGAIRDALAGFSADTLARLMEQAQEKTLALSLPKFEKESTLPLNKPLDNLGLSIAFSSKADFSKIGEDLFVSEVLQKTKIIVDEAGTEAAAATEITMKVTSLPPEPEITLDFNTPFAYFIVDTQSGLPLFMGIYESPS
ncbi:serpin family protein [Eubacterium barkeri]|nr:serpin family protein [Eubacterium barkeri]